MKNSEKNKQDNNLSLELLREKERERQCDNRVANVCKLVTSFLGWRDGMPINICDECWKAGVDSEESKKLRLKYADSVVDTVKAFFKKGNYGEAVSEAMFAKHLKPKVAERYLVSMCKKIGREKSIKYAKIIDKRLEDADDAE